MGPREVPQGAGAAIHVRPSPWQDALSTAGLSSSIHRLCRRSLTDQRMTYHWWIKCISGTFVTVAGAATCPDDLLPRRNSKRPRVWWRWWRWWTTRTTTPYQPDPSGNGSVVTSGLLARTSTNDKTGADIGTGRSYILFRVIRYLFYSVYAGTIASVLSSLYLLSTGDATTFGKHCEGYDWSISTVDWTEAERNEQYTRH